MALWANKCLPPSLKLELDAWAPTWKKETPPPDCPLTTIVWYVTHIYPSLSALKMVVCLFVVSVNRQC